MNNQAQQPQQPQQPVAAGAPNQQDIQQKQRDIGQVSGAPAGTLASFETVAPDDGVGNDVVCHGYGRAAP